MITLGHSQYAERGNSSGYTYRYYLLGYCWWMLRLLLMTLKLSGIAVVFYCYCQHSLLLLLLSATPDWYWDC